LDLLSLLAPLPSITIGSTITPMAARSFEWDSRRLTPRPPLKDALHRVVIAALLRRI